MRISPRAQWRLLLLFVGSTTFAATYAYAVTDWWGFLVVAILGLLLYVFSCSKGEYKS